MYMSQYTTAIEDNKCPAGGVVNAYHNSVMFRGVTTFASNTGSALRVGLYVSLEDGCLGEG